MNKILVDTNILIYALDKQSSFNSSASKILLDENAFIYVTTKSISEFFAVCTKLKYSQETILTFYKELVNYTTILFPSQNSLSLFEILFEKYKPIGNRIFDFEIASVMLANGITQIATFNTKDFAVIAEIELFEIK